MDDLGILSITPDQSEFLLRSLEQAGWSVGYHKNTNKTEFPHFPCQASKISR